MSPNTRNDLILCLSSPHQPHLILRILGREIQIRLPRQHQRLRLDTPQRLRIIPIERFLQAHIPCLPGADLTEQVIRVLGSSPCLPEVDHEVFESFKSDLFVELLAVESLAEAPTGVDPCECL